MNEKPDTVHGRLLEAAHIAGYSLERALKEFLWLMKDDKWKLCGNGFEWIDDFVATINFLEFKIAIEQRKEIVKILTDKRATQRAIGKMLGVSVGTVNADINPVQNRTKYKSSENINIDVKKNYGGEEINPVQNRTNLITRSPVEIIRASEKQDSRETKDIERKIKQEENRRLVEQAPPLPQTKAYTIVIDPPWDRNDEDDIDQFGRGQPTYKMKSLVELLEFPIDEKAENNAHLYLWITNRSLLKGAALFRAWGFRYITCLTWCKPSFGIGNYFRGATEQILFGVRGNLPLLRHDVGTWFQWPRGKTHSEKPEEFYDLVETCSQGPWMDLFARRQRPGWICWGAEL